MPKIPELQPQISTSPVSGARLTARASAEDMGAGIARGLGQVAQVTSQIAAKQKQDADALAVTDADRALAELETQLLYAQDTGALNVRGKNALGLPDTVLPEFEKGVGEIANGLANDEQRQVFRRLANGRITDVNRTVQRHVSREYETYDKAATEAALGNALQAAANNYNDPERVSTELTRGTAYIRSRAERTGAPPELLKAELEAFTSQTHVAVLDRMLAEKDYKGAQLYYKANGVDIAGTARDEVEKAIQVGMVRGESQRQADTIMSVHDDRAGALKAAREIKDPEVRDSVVARIDKRFDEQKQINDERRREVVQSATDLISNGGSVDDIPPGDWATLDRETRGNLRALAARGEWYQDDARWYDFTRKLQESPEDIANMNLFAEVRPYVDDAHWNQALAMQQAAQKALKGDPSDFNNELSFEQRLNDSLLASGIFDKTTGLEGADAQRYARIRTEAARLVEQESVAQGRKLSGQEIKQITDSVAARTVFNKNLIFADNEVAAGTIETDDVGETYVPLARIPDADLTHMGRIAESFGAKITQDKAQRAYAAYLIGDKAAFDAILQEPVR